MLDACNCKDRKCWKENQFRVSSKKMKKKRISHLNKKMKKKLDLLQKSPDWHVPNVDIKTRAIINSPIIVIPIMCVTSVQQNTMKKVNYCNTWETYTDEKLNVKHVTNRNFFCKVTKNYARLEKQRNLSKFQGKERNMNVKSAHMLLKMDLT